MKEVVVKALNSAGVRNTDLIEVPKDISKGDYSFPCFSLAKEMKKNPALIAKDISSKIKSEEFEKVEAVGGYVNFFIDRKYFAERVISGIGRGYKRNTDRVIVEYSQPNTHKAFHVGHVRGTSFGESLARIFEFTGSRVIRANYSGDTGKHVAKWLWCYNKFHAKERLKKEEKWFADIYVEAVQKLEGNDEYEKEVEEINRKLDSGDDKVLNALWKKTRDLSAAAWKEIYEDLGVKFDVQYFESGVEKEGKEMAKELVRKKIAEISQGATIMNLEKEGLGIWVLLRKDGTVLYSAKDIALAKKKFEDYKFDKSVIVTDSAQNLHFRQLIKTLELMKFDRWKDYNHLSYNQVRFPWGKMSSRTGENVLYSDLREEIFGYAKDEIVKREGRVKDLDKRALAIAIGAVKYWVLKQDKNKVIIFDPRKAIQFEGDTGPYILYSYARSKSILSKAGKNKLVIDSVSDVERKLLIEISRFNEIVDNARNNMDPSVVANYSYELARVFSEFYHDSQVIGSEEEGFRVELVRAFSVVMEDCLNLLGIPIVSRM